MPLIATISSKGQITLPKELRDRLGLTPGDEVVFTTVGESFAITPKNADFNSLAGLLGRPPKGPATLDQIDETIAQEAGNRASAAPSKVKGRAA